MVCYTFQFNLKKKFEFGNSEYTDIVSLFYGIILNIIVNQMI